MEILCDKTLDKVVFLRTHNSYSAEDLGYLYGASNHYKAIPQQLADGVRSLNLDVYFRKLDGDDREILWAYHGLPQIGKQRFAIILEHIRIFLVNNPHEVLLVDLQNESPTEEVVKGFEASGLVKFAHEQPKGAPWPTLREMIEKNKRMVLFSGGAKNTPAWFHQESDYVYSTPWSYKKPEELDCKLADSPFDNGLLEITHVLTAPVGGPEHAEKINHNPFLLDRMQECTKTLGRKPTMVSVDYYTIGDTLEAVRQLNLMPD